MNLNSLNGLIIFHLSLGSFFLSSLHSALGVWGANPHTLHPLGYLAFWLPVGFGKWKHWLEVRGQEREKLEYLFLLFPPCFSTVVLAMAAPFPLPSIPHL